MTMTPTSRRGLLFGAAALTLTAGCAKAAGGGNAAEAVFASSPWRKLTDAQWKARLPFDSYNTLRHEATEYPGSSPLLNEHRRGTFVCIGCELPLFKSDWKYESGTGWPSFYTAIAGALGKKTDMLIGIPRNEYHCARCLGHQGHVFNDGPRPTGLRYCNNGVAIKFVPA